MEQTKLVPKRRFKEFQNTDAWEQRKLSDGTLKIGDGLHGTPNYTDDGDVYFVNGNNLVNGEIIITEETKRVTTDEQSKDDKALDENTLLMSINGTIGNLAWYKGEKLMLGKSTAFITVSDFDKKFIYAYLQTDGVHNYFLNNLTGTTIKNLGLKAIRETKLFVPVIEEQSKIGSFFAKLDNLITLHQRKLEKTKALKSAYLSEMFPAEGERVPKRRFAGFTQPWEQRKLGDMVEEIIDNRGKTPPIVSSSQYPLLEVASLGNDTPDYSKVTKYVDKETYKNWFRQHIKKGDILFATVGNTGVTAMMDGAHQATIAQNIVGFRPNEKFNSEFMLQMFNLPGNLKKAKRIEMGAVQPSVKVSQLIDVKYSVPSKEEQVKVGTFFANLDHLITLHQRKLEKLQNIKKAYLNEMFV